MKKAKPAPYKLINAFEELSQQFMDELENVTYIGFDECTQEEIFKRKANLAVKLGKKYDTRLLIEKGIKAEEIGKPKFVERSILWAKERYGIEIKPKEVQKKKKQDKQTGLLYVGITTDRALNLLVKSKKLKILGDFNYRVKWIHDIYSQKLWEQLLTSYEAELNEKGDELIPLDDIQEALTNINDLRDILPVVEFTDRDFREITGLKHLSGEKIRELVIKYKEIKVDGEIEAYFDIRNKKFKKIMYNDCPFAEVSIRKSDKISNRNGRPMYIYRFLTTQYGLILLHNFLAHKFTKFPTEFYKLKRASQEIFRKVVQHEKSKFRIKTIFQYISYPENPSNWKAMMLLVENGLNELKDKKLIISWEKKGGFKEGQYKIKRK